MSPTTPRGARPERVPARHPATRGATALRGVVGAVVVGLVVACSPTVAPPDPATPTHDGDETAAPGVPLHPYQDPDLPVAERVDDLLGRMSLSAKVGQMTQAERSVAGPDEVLAYQLGSVLSGGGSVPEPNTPDSWAAMVDALQLAALGTPLGIPVLYGVDAVHGHNNLAGATVFPHNIGLGATRNPELVEAIGAATAVEVAATGPLWTFSPCLCVARDDGWGRTYESFSSDPGLVSEMASIVRGYQGEVLGRGRTSVLATAKHFVADGGTDGGIDQGDATLTEDELRAVHLPPYEAAIALGVGSVMASFSSWNGDKVHGHRYLLTDLLKDELGFEGFVVSDWAAIDQLDGRAGFTVEEIAEAVGAGIDMVMVPHDYVEFIAGLTEAVETELVPMARIDDAVRRILTVKFALGLFEDPWARQDLAGQVGSPAHRELAREAVTQSLVVLTNAGALPIAPDARVLVAGANADDVGHQSGGWTLEWQGVSGDVPGGTSILEGLEQVAGPDGEVVFSPRADDDGVSGAFDVAVAVVGERPYAEYMGDNLGGAALSDEDVALVDRLRSLGLPTVVVVVSGRPVDLRGVDASADAVVAAWLPGTEGAGVADVLYGVVEPHGLLPMDWQQRPGVEAVYPFGHGVTEW